MGDEYRTPTDRGEYIAARIAQNLDLSWFRDYMSGKKNQVQLVELEEIAKDFHTAFDRKELRDELIHILLRGPDGDASCQRSLYEAVKGWKMNELAFDDPGAWIGRVLATSGIAPELRKALEDIQQLERLLVTANCLFSYCRRKDGESLGVVSINIARDYHFGWIPEGPDLTGVYYAEELTRFREALRNKDVETAVRTLLALNKKVMDGRDGAAWVEEKPEGRLKVRVRKEIAELPGQDLLTSAWDYNYFLASYARIAQQRRAR